MSINYFAITRPTAPGPRTRSVAGQQVLAPASTLTSAQMAAAESKRPTARTDAELIAGIFDAFSSQLFH